MPPSSRVSGTVPYRTVTIRGGRCLKGSGEGKRSGCQGPARAHRTLVEAWSDSSRLTARSPDHQRAERLVSGYAVIHLVTGPDDTHHSWDEQMRLTVHDMFEFAREHVEDLDGRVIVSTPRDGAGGR